MQRVVGPRKSRRDRIAPTAGDWGSWPTMAPMQADSDPDAQPSSAPIRKKDIIKRELLDDHAIFVVKRLQREGHEAYLVGGCVRDLLAGLEPKDFDVAADARPNRIKRLFRSARVIGRRFRLVHIRFPGDLLIETATFRGDPERLAREAEEQEEAEASQGGRGGRRGDWRDSVENIFGTAEEDARRRDFTVNALFYDPVANEVIDWVGGLADMDAGVIRSIGEPSVRIAEDPVRMLRAVHYAKRLDFKLEPTLATAIAEHAGSLADASQARLYIELIKMLSRGCARNAFRELHALGVLGIWLPKLTAALDEPATWPSEGGGTHEEASLGEPVDVPIGHATWNLLGAADHFGLAAHQAPESLTLSALFGPWILRTWRRKSGGGFHAFMDHFDDIFRPVALRMSIPRWASMQMRDVLWLLEDLRSPPPGKKAQRLVHRPAFAEALAFLELDLRARAADLAPLEFWRALAEEENVDLALVKPQRARQPRGRAGGGRRGGRARSRGGRSRGRGRGGQGSKRRGGQERSADAPPARPARPAPEASAWDDPPDF